jgi:hypothetical protein
MKHILEYNKFNTTLKAPNGQKSNLTEKQWHQVRTPEFKAWFGDWLNNPQNASKVLDENGEPLVVYHGTKSSKKIDTFEFYGGRIGFWFIPNKKIAKNLFNDTNKIYNVYLNIRNPKNIESTESFTDNNENDAWLKLWSMTDRFNYIKEEELRNHLIEDGFDSIILKNSKKDILDKDWKNAKGENQIIVFTSNQIKSAIDNNGNFNTENNNIYR